MAICLRTANTDPIRPSDGDCAVKDHSPLIIGVNIFFWGGVDSFTFTWVTTTSYPTQEVVMLIKEPLGVFMPRQKWARDLGAGTSHTGLLPNSKYQVLVRAETLTEFSRWQEFFIWTDPAWDSSKIEVWFNYNPVYQLTEQVFL